MTWRVLLAEDEPDIQWIICGALEDIGIEVVAVSDGLEALEAARVQRFDLVLLDVMMPRLDGYETLRRLKATPETAAIPVIFLTAKAMDEERARGEALGATGYLTKPFDADELGEHVRACLENADRSQ